VNWFKNYGKVTMRNDTLKLSVRININAAVYRCGTVEKIYFEDNLTVNRRNLCTSILLNDRTVYLV